MKQSTHSYFGITSDREVMLHLFINYSKFSDLIFVFIEMKIIWRGNRILGMIKTKKIS